MNKQEELKEKLQKRIKWNKGCLVMLKKVINTYGREEACKKLQITKSNLSQIINPKASYPRMYPQAKISILISTYNEIL
jgi:hypothetical protein